MKTEQIERIADHLQSNGYGWISKKDCRKIVLMVHSELVVDAVFTPLQKVREGRITLTVEQIEGLAKFAGYEVGENITDQDRDTEITVEFCSTEGVKDDDGATKHYRHVAYLDEYPEEGVYPLGPALDKSLLKGGRPG